MSGELVWVPDPNEGFKIGRLRDKNKNTAWVSLPNSEHPSHFKPEEVYPTGDPEEMKDDNCALMHLNVATLLNNVKIRYAQNKIYTYVANILIALNPYYEIKDMYSDTTMTAYRGESLGAQPPHIFAIAEKSFLDMKVLKKSQSIIVSGESGAGKTESTKYLLRYLCNLKRSSAGSIEQNILDANPVLEAFGNAKTPRNNNSSRFGKFMEVQFNNHYQVVGGSVSHYLLEKSRICLQSQDDRNYHIFYMMCAGAPAELRSELSITEPDDFHYLNNGCTKYFYKDRSKGNPTKKEGLPDPNLDDAEDFNKVHKAFNNLGIKDEELNEIYKIVAAVLHLGNIEFEKNTQDKSSICLVAKSAAFFVEMSAELLGVKLEMLQYALVIKTVEVSKEPVLRRLDIDEAKYARNALAKAIYSKLFDYIVSRINSSMTTDSRKGSSNYIGVLDIAGFESFKINSFEQFCINYCNEKLQQFFNMRILESEQELYAKESLEFSYIDYASNEDCIKLIEDRPNGILNILDDESKFNPDPKKFIETVRRRTKISDSIAWQRDDDFKTLCQPQNDLQFIIKHFAGPVCYQTDQFIEKNNDALHASLRALIQSSTNNILKTQFVDSPTSDKNKKPPTVGSKFKTDLAKLIKKLESNGTNFVRCIKPNNEMAAHKFDGSSVLSQLRYSGMISVLKLMEHGYPSHVRFQDLYDKYKKSDSELAELEPKLFCEVLVRSLDLNSEDFQFGRTMMFFKPGKFVVFDKIMASNPENLKKLVADARKWLRNSRMTEITNLKRECFKMWKTVEQLENAGDTGYIDELEKNLETGWKDINENKSMKFMDICNLYSKLKKDFDDIKTDLKEKEKQQEIKKQQLREAEMERKKQEELTKKSEQEKINKEAKMANCMSNLFQWKYSELHAAFYDSDNPELQKASLQEINRRLEAYEDWKVKNDTKRDD